MPAESHRDGGEREGGEGMLYWWTRSFAVPTGQSIGYPVTTGTYCLTNRLLNGRGTIIDAEYQGYRHELPDIGSLGHETRRLMPIR